MEDTDLAGELIGGRWRVTDLLGHGGFGRVFRCTDESDIGLGTAAVKVLHPNTSPLERNEFLREVQKIATLRHQNLVGYLDSGVHHLAGEPHPFLVTELCSGSLADHLASVPGCRMSTEQVIAALIHMTDGLTHLHERSLIHRDLKPGNVLYGDGAWKLADFGLMRDLTATGSYHRGDAITGTPLFMAPELFATMTATAPSDVYAMAVMAHMMLTGRTVHAGSGQALIHAVTTVPPVIDETIDPALRQLITAAVHRDPSQRLTARQFHERLVSPPAAGIPQPSPRSVQSQTTLAAPAPIARRTPPTATPPTSTPFTAPPNAPSDGWPAPQPTPQSFSAPAPAAPPAPTFPAAAVPGAPPVGPSAEGSTGGKAALIILGVFGVIGVLLILFLASSVFLLRGQDGTETSPIEAGTATREPDRPTEAASDSVVIGDDVIIGDSVEIGGDAGGEETNGPVAEPMSHLETVPCASDLVDQLQVTNRHDSHVDYVAEISYFDQNGTRISDQRGTLKALAPGAQASLGMASSEEGAASCELDSLLLTPTDPLLIEQRSLADITSCETDGSWHTVVMTVMNPGPESVDAEVYVAVVDVNGVRLDEDWAGTTIYDIGVGETVREDESHVFWNLDSLDRPPVECEIIAVEFDR